MTTHKTKTRTLEALSNLYHTQDGWQVMIALPDVDTDSITLDTVGHTLNLKAHTLDQSTNYVRTIHFPAHVRWGDLNATWHDGLLKVDLKRADTQSQRIDIQITA